MEKQMATTAQDIQKELNQKAAQQLQENNQKKMEQDQANMAANNQEMLNPNQETEQNTKNMDVKKDPNKNLDLNQMCDDWLKRYKKQKPDFDEDENKFKVDQAKGRITLEFKNSQAEEDFLRDLAKQGADGGVTMGGDLIALTKNGELIDPRTNKAFPEGGYKELVDQLKAGKNYNDIPIPTPSKSSAEFTENASKLENTPKAAKNSPEPVAKSLDSEPPMSAPRSSKSNMEMPESPQQEIPGTDNSEVNAPSMSPCQNS